MKRILLTLVAVISTITAFSQDEVPLKNCEHYINQVREENLNTLYDNDITTVYRIWSPMILPYRVTWILPENTVFTSVKWFVNNGNVSTWKLYYIRKRDSAKIKFFEFKGGYWLPAWQYDTFPKLDTALRLIWESDQATDAPEELHLYGNFTPFPPPTQFARKHYNIKDMIGVVCHPWDMDYTYRGDPIWEFSNTEKTRMWNRLGIGHVRIYANASYTNYGYGDYNFEGWRIRENSKRFDSMGVKIQYCYQDQAPDVFDSWVADGDSSKNHGLNFFYQYNNDTDRLKESTYWNLGHDAALMARYANGQPRWWTFEGGNELDASWKGLNGYMTGEQQAALNSNIYDSLKKVNQSIRVINAGFASDKPDRLFEMLDWCNLHNRKLPMDEISIHFYPSLGGQYSSGNKGGVPMEYLSDKLERMVRWTYQYAEGKPLNIGEFNWDINQIGGINVPLIGGRSAEDSRAALGTRAILFGGKLGIASIDFYRFTMDYAPWLGGNDWSLNSGNDFASMSLVRQTDDSGHFAMTALGDHLGQMSRTFGNFHFTEAIRDDSVQVYKMTDGERLAIPVWGVEKVEVPTEYGLRPIVTERKGTVNIPYKGIKYTFSFDSSGVMNQEPFNGGDVEYSSEPFFILVQQAVALPLRIISFTAKRDISVVQLSWKVEGAVRYEVERSGDGINWVTIGKTASNTLVDYVPLSGVNYYRLKAIEDNGAFDYSRIQVVEMPVMLREVNIYNVLGQLLIHKKASSGNAVKQLLQKGSAYIIEESMNGHNFSYKYFAH